jgi:hypothetical protein
VIAVKTFDLIAIRKCVGGITKVIGAIRKSFAPIQKVIAAIGKVVGRIEKLFASEGKTLGAIGKWIRRLGKSFGSRGNLRAAAKRDADRDGGADAEQRAADGHRVQRRPGARPDGFLDRDEEDAHGRARERARDEAPDARRAPFPFGQTRNERREERDERRE